MIDVTAKQRAYAEHLFRTDPEKAVREGYTDVNGTPLDIRETLPTGAKNPFYGKPLRPVFVRQSVGIGRPARGGDLKLMILTQMLDQAKNPPPLGKSVRFLGRMRLQDELHYQINSVRATKFNPVTLKEFPEVAPQTVVKILQDAPDVYKVTCADLEAWHREHASDIRRVCILEGDVMLIRREPTAFGSYMMVIEDETIMDLAGVGITVWVHEDIKHMLDFAVGSRVIIVGRTVIGPGWNPETRQLDREIERVMVNAFGVWAIPEYKIPLEEERVLIPTEEV